VPVRRPRRGQSGLSLIELLIAGGLMLVLLLGVLGTFDGFTSVKTRVVKQNEAEAAARSAIGQIVRQARNVAGAGVTPQLVERAGASDLIIQSIDPAGPNSGQNVTNIRRVRYCLNASNPASATLWQATQSWTTAAPPAAPTTTDCPGTGWPSTTALAGNITNLRDGLSRPLFSYDSATLSSITRIAIAVWIDPTPGTGAAERSLTSGVYLRNQNRAPTASFTATAIANHHVILNGAASADPDGQYLAYDWYAGGVFVGRGTVLDYAAPAAGQVSFTLTVSDTGGLSTSAPAQVVSVP
jgi:type II secretory pathway pseudopilin PulG